MERYGNLNGDSGVVAFEIRAGSILVEFTDNSQYLYDASKPGPAAVSELQKLARAGRGLNSYINRFIGKNYARKIR
jgi:hypothetical protein